MYWVFTPEPKKPAMLTLELDQPKGWTSKRQGNYRALRSESQHAVVEVIAPAQDWVDLKGEPDEKAGQKTPKRSSWLRRFRSTPPSPRSLPLEGRELRQQVFGPSCGGDGARRMLGGGVGLEGADSAPWEVRRGSRCLARRAGLAIGGHRGAQVCSAAWSARVELGSASSAARRRSRRRGWRLARPRPSRGTTLA